MKLDTYDWENPVWIRKNMIQDRINRIRFCKKMARECTDNEFARDGWLAMAKEWQEDLAELKQPPRLPFRYKEVSE